MVDASKPPGTIFVCGFPGRVGGANTELWHTLKLWRGIGLDVTVIPPWGAADQGDDYGYWAVQLAELGCRIESCPGPSMLSNVQGLPGSIVAAFCSTKFLAAAHRFRALGCRIVWVNCMNFLVPGEARHLRRHGTFDRYVFQSRYQRNRLEPLLSPFGYGQEQGRLIRGAFDVAEFPFEPRPRTTAEPFLIGRISRAAREKFSASTWGIYGRIPDVRARVMGFGPEAQAVTGQPPAFVECCLPENAMPSREFLATLHALVMPTATFENWPRVGLEAMAAGVPLVVDDRGGWREMIRHGETGFLCASDDDFVRHATALAEDEYLRLRVANAARKAVERLTDPATIGAAWLNLFSDLE